MYIKAGFVVDDYYHHLTSFFCVFVYARMLG